MMRSTIRSLAVTALLSAAVLAAGCSTSEAKPTAGVLTAEGTEQLQKETKEAVQAAKNYAYAVRAEFVKDMQEEVATINRAVQQLSDKIESSNSAAKADAKAKLVALRDKAAALNGELEKAKSASADACDQVKAGFKKSHEDLKESVAQARTWMSEKIAP